MDFYKGYGICNIPSVNSFKLKSQSVRRELETEIWLKNGLLVKIKQKQTNEETPLSLWLKKKKKWYKGNRRTYINSPWNKNLHWFSICQGMFKSKLLPKKSLTYILENRQQWNLCSVIPHPNINFISGLYSIFMYH